MNNSMTFRLRPMGIGLVAATVKKFNNAISRPVNELGQYYSRVLDRRLDRRQTLSLIEAQTAFLVALVAGESPLLLRVALLAWAVADVCRCRRLLHE